MPTHKTVVEGWADDESFAVACLNCKWDTYDLRLRTHVHAYTAAIMHEAVAEALANPSVYPIVDAANNHHLLTGSLGSGRIDCSCGDWSGYGHPISVETVTQLWMLHYAEQMRQVITTLA